MMDEKSCTKCGQTKPLSDFYLYKRGKDRHRTECKACTKKRARDWQIANPEKTKEKKQRWHIANFEITKERSRRYQVENRDKVNEANRKWKAAHPENGKENTRRWRAANPERVRENQRKRYATNPAKGREKSRKWIIENPDKAKEIRHRAHAKTYATRKGKINVSMSVGMKRSLKKGGKAGRHWESLVDFTRDQLIKHLEKQFQPGMSWDNYGEWHIDHKIPKSAFNYNTTDDIDFKRCWALKNLQPLWASENFSKHNKLDKPFQPSFVFTS